MSESRICPVCGTLIPSVKMSSCPMCDFDLENLNNEEAIEKTKQSFTRQTTSPINEVTSENTKILGWVGTSITRYLVIGIIIFFVVVIFAEFEIIWSSHEWAMLLACYLNAGLLTGVTYVILFFVSRLRKK